MKSTLSVYSAPW